ncbi:MAG: SH3 domain-containing protein [Treponemataceae bacterium]|nr:SH3 domain-containing protein [Treponemataceae bacterium]
MKSCLLCLIAAAAASCSGVMGYGVLLWNVPEQGLQDGTVLPVYIKSNISHVYVVGTGSGKAEVPLWQLTAPESKRNAEKTAARLAEYRHQYASVALDGLPMRAEPVNTAKQVYRLRKDEVIKVLYKGDGQAVMSGQTALQGDWLRVLTSEGTEGWCFSYNLRLFSAESAVAAAVPAAPAGGDAQDEGIPAFLEKVWYPESYQAMISSGRIDVSALNPGWNLHFDAEGRKLSLALRDVQEVWNFTGADEDGAGRYAFRDIPISVTVKNDSFIVVRYTGRNGKPVDYNMVAIDEDVAALVQAELARRETEYEQIFMFGPRFKSSSYGTLVLREDHSFTWTNNRLLVSSSIIPSSAKNTGTVRVQYFLGRGLSAAYDGVLTFLFDGMNREVNFLYKLEENGLRLEDVSGAAITDSTVQRRSLSPLVLFFSKDN